MNKKANLFAWNFPGDYRISLLPNISKIFESFIHDSLTKHLDIYTVHCQGCFKEIELPL